MRTVTGTLCGVFIQKPPSEFNDMSDRLIMASVGYRQVSIENIIEMVYQSGKIHRQSCQCQPGELAAQGSNSGGLSTGEVYFKPQTVTTAPAGLTINQTS